jgi:hypothetical protein
LQARKPSPKTSSPHTLIFQSPELWEHNFSVNSPGLGILLRQSELTNKKKVSTENSPAIQNPESWPWYSHFLLLYGSQSPLLKWLKASVSSSVPPSTWLFLDPNACGGVESAENICSFHSIHPPGHHPLPASLHAPLDMSETWLWLQFCCQSALAKNLSFLIHKLGWGNGPRVSSPLYF